MRSAILLSGRRLGPADYHFLSKLRNCTEVAGAISFPSRRKKRRKHLIKKFAMRKPWQIIALAIGHFRFRKVCRARHEAFEGDICLLDDLDIIDVKNLEEAAKQARAWDVQVLFQLTAGIIREPLLSAARYGVLSFHHGIMPLLRGLASPFWAIYMDRPELLGITLQRLKERLDEGTILAQSNVSVEKDDSFADINLRLDKAGAEMIEPTIRQLETRKQWLEPRPGKQLYRSHPGLINQLFFAYKFRKFRRKHGS